MQLGIRNVSKAFGTTRVLDDVSFEVAEREFFFLLGPSGCGKTTLLRLIAGFYQPDRGEVRFDDLVMNQVDPHKRNTGMVFQNYALWPHLTVAQNVAYGLEVRKVGAAERKSRVAEALRMVRMEGYGERLPNQLSGGQQQRVALARAVVIRPDILLLDEPLSNLDARLRLEMRDELRRIHDETRLTTVYVTHDQKEALSLADRMAVLRDGVVEQVGRPRDVYRRPASRFVADFMGEANWLAGTLLQADAQQTVVESAVGRLTCAPSPSPVPVGSTVELGFRPESVRLGDGHANTLAATIESRTYLGEIEQYALRLSDGSRIKAIEQDPSVARRPGDAVRIHLAPASVFLLART